MSEVARAQKVLWGDPFLAQAQALPRLLLLQPSWPSYSNLESFLNRKEQLWRRASIRQRP